jgi:hypothetical protein
MARPKVPEAMLLPRILNAEVSVATGAAVMGGGVVIVGRTDRLHCIADSARFHEGVVT